MKTAPPPLVLCKLTCSNFEPGFGMTLLTPLLSPHCADLVAFKL